MVKNRNKKLEIINSNLSQLPNFSCSLQNNSTSKINKKISLKTVKILLDQALSAQLIAFQKFGFVHGDIHINNFIMVEENFKYNYNFNFRKYKNIKGETNLKVIIIDFGESEFLLPEYRSQYTDDYYDESDKLPRREFREENNTLPANIHETFVTLLKLTKKYNKYKKILDEHETYENPTLDYYHNLFYTGQSMLFHSQNYEYFIKRTMQKIIFMINSYYKAIFNVEFLELTDE